MANVCVNCGIGDLNKKLGKKSEAKVKVSSSGKAVKNGKKNVGVGKRVSER